MFSGTATGCYPSSAWRKSAGAACWSRRCSRASTTGLSRDDRQVGIDVELSLLRTSVKSVVEHKARQERAALHKVKFVENT